MLIINGVNIENYAESFNEFHLDSVLQFLEVFKWDQQAEDWLREYLATTQRTGRATGASAPYEKDMTFGPGVIIGYHDCGGKITRYKIKKCHTNSTGRLTYEECNKCNYYKETFTEEVEGG